MRVQINLMLVSSIVMLALVLLIAPTDAFAVCDHEPDGPDCPCFDHTGAWSPAGAFIQDIAIATVGTRESCVEDGGKPYYQMVLGCNSELCALFVSWALSTFGPIYDGREWWCSETISYWHREAGIPYPGGYATSWHTDWQNHGVGSLKSWYETAEGTSGGRGRWIDPEDVDYDDFELGVTVPVPGAYVAIRRYDDVNDVWYSGDLAGSHSLMINEMWVHTDALGVFEVEVTLLEGNSGETVTNTRHWDDVLSLTPQGSDWIGTSKKIYGFGIDLNSRGQLIYDESRLHSVFHPGIAIRPPIWPILPKDPDWDRYRPVIPRLIAYADLLREKGGPDIKCLPPELNFTGIPDGLQVQWDFPKSITETMDVEVEIDLQDVHPLPIRAVVLRWYDVPWVDGEGTPPDQFARADQEYSTENPRVRVQFAGADKEYQDAIMPDLGKVVPPVQSPSVLVPAMFGSSGTGVKVRYVKLILEKGVFHKDATLEELRFRYYQRLWDDAKDNPIDCFPRAYSTYNDWAKLGKPSCWCRPYQCDGDADDKTQGFQMYRVMSNDLNVIAANWKRTIDDPKLNPCADIDHKSQGFQAYRVMSNDLAVLVENWKKTDKDLPGNCPRKE